MKLIDLLKAMLLVVVMTAGSANVWGETVYTLNLAAQSSAFGTANAYTAKSGTVNGVAWYINSGSCQSTANVWLGANNAQNRTNLCKLDEGLNGRGEAIAAALDISASDVGYYAIVATNNILNVDTVTVKAGATGGTAPSKMWCLYSTDNGVTYSILDDEKTSPGTSLVTFTASSTIASAQYAFVWYSSAFGTYRESKFDFIKAPYNIKTPYNITLDAGAGTVSQPSNPITSLSLPTPKLPVACLTDGWTFAGWAESENSSTFVTNPYIPTSDITLYAVYKKEADPVKSFQQVTTLTDFDYSGEYAVVGGHTPSGAYRALDESTAINTNYLNEYAVTVSGSNNILTMAYSAAIPTWQFAGNASAFTMTKGNKILFASSTSNMNAVNTGGSYSTFSLAAATSSDIGGTDNSNLTNRFVFTVQNQSGYYLYYNQSATRFRHYNSSPSVTMIRALYLFKVVETSLFTTYNSNPDCTSACEIDAPEVSEASDETANSFTANWEEVANATGYELYVYTKTGPVIATDLFISQYYEGISNEKAIEIYNGTGAAVDLSNYAIGGMTYNSSNIYVTTPTPLTLSGILENGKTFLCVSNNNSPNLTVLDYDLTSADNVMSFNGNDISTLLKNNEIIDYVGIIGENWGEDKTFIRNSNVLSPNTAFTPSEWTVLNIIASLDYATTLGVHTFDGRNYLEGYNPINVTKTSQKVTGLASEVEYCYVVKTKGEDGCVSEESEETCVTTIAVPSITATPNEISLNINLAENACVSSSFVISGEHLEDEDIISVTVNNSLFEITGTNKDGDVLLDEGELSFEAQYLPLIVNFTYCPTNVTTTSDEAVFTIESIATEPIEVSVSGTAVDICTPRTITLTPAIAASTIVFNEEDKKYSRTATLSAGAGTITWTSSNPEYAFMVNETGAIGEAQLVAFGTTRITASVERDGAYCAASQFYDLTVTCGAPFTIGTTAPSRFITSGGYNMWIGQSPPNNILDVAFSGSSITYSSSNENTATINSEGYVTFHNVGETTITVSYDGTFPFCAREESFVLTVLPPHTITLNAGTGSVEPSVIIHTSNSIILPKATTACEGWEFAGWVEHEKVQESTILPNFVSQLAYTPTGDVTLFAVYKQEGEDGEFENYTPNTETQQFVIAAKVADVYYALLANSFTTGTQTPVIIETRTSSDVVYVDPTTSSGYSWTIAGDNTTGFTINTNENYLRISGTANSSSIVCNATAINDRALWTINPGATGSYRVSTKQENTRGLGFNVTINTTTGTPYNLMGNYAGSNLNNIASGYLDIELLPIGNAGTVTYNSTPCPRLYYQTVAFGTWNNKIIWESSADGWNGNFNPADDFPDGSDKFVRIRKVENTGHTVTLNESVSVQRVEIQAGGELIVEEQGDLTIAGDLMLHKANGDASSVEDDGTMTINGKVKVTVTFENADLWNHVSFPFNIAEVRKLNGSLAVHNTDYWTAKYNIYERANNNKHQWDYTNGIVANEPCIIWSAETLVFEAATVPDFSTAAINNHEKWSAYVADIRDREEDFNGGWSQVVYPAFSKSAKKELLEGQMVYKYAYPNDNYETEDDPVVDNNNYTFGSYFVKMKKGSEHIVKENEEDAGKYPHIYSHGKFSGARAMSNENIVVKLRGSNGYDYRTKIRVRPEATTGYDGLYDAYHFMAALTTTPQIYSLIFANKMAINAVPEQSTVPIGIRVPTTGEYTIYWENNITEQNAIFYDQNIEIDMSAQSEYTFTTTQTGEINNRFYISFTEKDEPIVITPQYKNDNIIVYTTAGNIIVEGLNIGDAVKMFDITGRILYAKQAAATSIQLQAPAKGVYLLNINDKTIKVIFQ